MSPNFQREFGRAKERKRLPGNEANAEDEEIFLKGKKNYRGICAP